MCDILGSLPLELLIHVIEYLDLKDNVRSQRVSKRWREILSFDAIINPFFREALIFLGLDQEGVKTDITVTSRMRYIGWRHCLEQVRPLKKIFLPWPAHFSSESNTVRWHSRRLFYDVPGRGEVEMINFETGEKSTWAAGSTEEIKAWVSDRYLIITSLLEKDRLYDLTAYDLHYERKINQQLPPGFSLDAIVEDKVVFRSQDTLFSLYVWDLSSNHAQHIGSFLNLDLYHVDSASNELVTFNVDWFKRQPEVRQTKWRIATGQLLARKTFHLPLRKMGPSLPGIDQCHTKGSRTVNQLFFLTDFFYDWFQSIYLVYDHGADELSVKWRRTEDDIDSISTKTYLTPNLIHLWNWNSGRVNAYNVPAGTVAVHNVREQCSSWTCVLREWCKDWADDQPPVAISGDREVFCFSNEIGIELWFFNPNFVPDPQELERKLSRSIENV